MTLHYATDEAHVYEMKTDNLGAIGVEEHTISTARSAMVYLDSGYTMYVFCQSRIVHQGNY